MRFLRTREVLEMIGVGRTTLWKMVHAGTFPRPARITERSSGYLLEAVEQWMRLRAQGLPWQVDRGGVNLVRAHPRQRRLRLARSVGSPQGPVR
jgi:prophage regulatory protein